MTVMDAVEIERCTSKKLPSSIKKISERKKSSSKSSGKSSARKKRVIGQGKYGILFLKIIDIDKSVFLFTMLAKIVSRTFVLLL